MSRNAAQWGKTRGAQPKLGLGLPRWRTDGCRVHADSQQRDVLPADGSCVSLKINSASYLHHTSHTHLTHVHKGSPVCLATPCEWS